MALKATRYSGAIRYSKSVDTKSGKARVYHDPKGRLLIKTKYGAPSQKTGLERALNSYYERGGKRRFDYVYAMDSKVIKGTEKLYALRFKDDSGERFRGWMNEYGEFATVKDIRGTLYSIDQTHAALINDGSPLVTWFDHLSLKEQAKVAEYILNDLNVRDLWEIYYQEEGEISFFDKYLEIVDELDAIAPLEKGLEDIPEDFDPARDKFHF